MIGIRHHGSCLPPDGRPSHAADRRSVRRGSKPRRGSRTPEAGSALLLVLLLCLGSALLITSLAAVLLCCERAVADEKEGRARLSEKDVILSALAQQAGAAWEARDWSEVGSGEGALDNVNDGQGWLLQAFARQDPSISHITVSALVERGRDGIDLPVAAAVVASVSTPAGRTKPWLESDAGDGQASDQAACYLQGPVDSSLLGPGCAAGKISNQWHLDPGSAELLGAIGRAGGAGAEDGLAVHAVSGVVVLEGGPGTTVRLPTGTGGTSADEPILAVVTGGAALDLTGLGDLFGVAVANGGAIMLDRTTLHGAAYATETLDMGTTGQIRFSRSILRWATDRSLVRARLMPGTREEGTE